MDIINKARQKAQELHKHQVRKSGGLPYFTHLENVAKITAQYTSKPELIAAAYLHDTIEDTPYTPSDLERDFGSRITQVVLSVTKKTNSNTEYLNKINNKETALIAGADKLDNSIGLTTVVDWNVFNFSPKVKISSYKEVAKKVSHYYPELARRIEQQLNSIGATC